MATKRRIVFGNQVRKHRLLERDSFAAGSPPDSHQEKLAVDIYDEWGSKGSIEINNEQTDTGWTTMVHPNVSLWESTRTWEAMKKPWNGALLVGAAAHLSLVPTSTDIVFVHIKNVGPDYGSDGKVQFSIDGGTNYPIEIPAGDSISIPTVPLRTADLYVRKTSGDDDTYIEYIIAEGP